MGKSAVISTTASIHFEAFATALPLPERTGSCPRNRLNPGQKSGMLPVMGTAAFVTGIINAYVASRLATVLRVREKYSSED